MVTYCYDSLVDNEHSQFSTVASTITQNDIATDLPPPVSIPSWDDPYITESFNALSHCLAKQANIIYTYNKARFYYTHAIVHTRQNMNLASLESMLRMKILTSGS